MALDLMAAFTELPPPIDYVLPNMVAGTVGALVSPGGAGKSMLALQLAAQIAGGPDLLELARFPPGKGSIRLLKVHRPAIPIRFPALGANPGAPNGKAVLVVCSVHPWIGKRPTAWLL